MSRTQRAAGRPHKLFVSVQKAVKILYLEQLHKNAAQQSNHFRERQIRSLGIESRALIPHKGMLRRKYLNAMVYSSLFQHLCDFDAALRGNMGIVAAKNHEQFAANLTGPQQ